VRASIGIALFPDHEVDAQSLLRQADVAMYTAKRGGGGVRVYDPRTDGHSPTRYALEGDLRRAIERDELELYYQPKVDFAGGTITRVEALVRWRHPQQGLLSPDAFIPLAEATGLIRPLSRWVLNAALQQYRAWRDAGLELPIAVNLSVHDLQDRALPSYIALLLNRWDADCDCLVVELTESAIMGDPEQALQVLTELSVLGVKIAIDDFGIGYSSLGYLARLPVDQLKIDKSLITHMGEQERAIAIVRATVEMAHHLGVPVVAEGVEDQTTWDLLGALGTDGGQGYFVTPPLPPRALREWLTTAPWPLGAEAA
jgi:EAL domain-containing protein (putative c-di-GMP-specific phosphodiesterase class I)